MWSLRSGLSRTQDPSFSHSRPRFALVDMNTRHTCDRDPISFKDDAIVASHVLECSAFGRRVTLIGSMNLARINCDPTSPLPWGVVASVHGSRCLFTISSAELRCLHLVVRR